NEGQFKLFPQPPPEGLDIHYEYVNKNWVYDVEGDTYVDKVSKATDQPQYDKTLISRYVKVKFLEAKGFDSAKAQADFNQQFSFLTGLDKGAEVLYAGGRRGFPYIDMWRNVPDTNYGY
ncbi:MAG: hypothetical protein GWN94_20735, partial [Phycisphaerae bacterium]|nr:hypothetical protein [Phycisphaerae bacterium]